LQGDGREPHHAEVVSGHLVDEPHVALEVGKLVDFFGMPEGEMDKPIVGH
jgi:hypothetical protein